MLHTLIRSKQLSSKCTEHRWDCLEGFQPGRCLRTNFVLLFRLSGSQGKLCKLTFLVNCLFLQLIILGPPATQYLPPFFSLSLSASSTESSFLRHNVVTWSFWPRGKQNHFSARRTKLSCAKKIVSNRFEPLKPFSLRPHKVKPFRNRKNEIIS